MDDPKWNPPRWLDWAVMIAVVVIIVIAALSFFWPQIHNTYETLPDTLWLHLVGR